MPAPDFICVGMQKSGTRWLFEQLRSHPDFWLPPLKELHFFDAKFPSEKGKASLSRAVARGRLPADAADRDFIDLISAVEPRRDHDFETYFSLFAMARGKLTGELTPDYAGLPPATIRDMAAAMPGMRIILMVRDPVQRAWSALNDAANDGKLDPASVTDPEVMLRALRSPTLARNSFPSHAWQRWSAAFPCQAFFLEDVSARPEAARDEVLRYLGASTSKPVPLPASYNSKAGRPRVTLTPALSAALAHHFREELDACARTFGGPAKAWPGRYDHEPAPLGPA